MKINDAVKLSHKMAKEKGFWEKERNFAEIIALCHSELSEALEEKRIGFDVDYDYYDEKGKPCGVPYELADCIIRIFDVCGYYDIDLEDIILDKINYNSQREYKHGKEF